MLLAIDIGNTNVAFGLFEGGTLRQDGHFETQRARGLKELEASLPDSKGVDAVAISNVVPALTQNLFEAVRNLYNQKPLWVNAETAKIPLRVDNPREVGADRLCNAAAAWEKFKKAAMVVDFGTATTLDIITAKGEYGGGAICPGLEMAGKSLAEGTAQLPKVKIQKPKRVVGRNTVECIQAGLYHGYIGMIDHLVRLSIKEEGCSMKVVATGGLANLIARESKTIEAVEPFLTLEGVYYIWKRNL
ncbi:MAG: type III pantothenate kinase [Deltaproteobacteria bacterium]|nr:type III pantothenate kinase [Deltaproteobacteria bacterium]